MPTLTPSEIYQVCLSAGFTPDQAVTWTAIALAESGGNTGAHNPNGEDSWGLWQINVDPAVRPNHWGDLTDPVVNARAAYEVSGGGTNLRPWTVTHASNQGTAHDYRQYMDEARAAAGGAYLGDFSGVSGYDDPSPGGAADVTAAAPGPSVTAPPEPDADIDGVPDSFEMSRGTDPQLADTDADGLTDGFEQMAGSDPLAVDTDHDGLSDAYEVEVGSNPLASDSDADELADALEVASGRDPGLGLAPGASGPAVDTDHDGLSDAIEAVLGTDATVADTDTDGILDALEQAQGTDARLFDSDGDGILDGTDADPMGRGPGPMPGAGGLPGLGGVPGLPVMPGAGVPGGGSVPGFGGVGIPAVGGVGPGGVPGMPGVGVPGLPEVGGVGMPGVPGTPVGGFSGMPGPGVPGPAAQMHALDDPAGASSGRVQQFLDLALAQTGDTYVFGGEAQVEDADPDVFDCSELIQWAGGRVGVELPDGSWLQYLELRGQGALIPVEQAIDTPGALLFSFDREPTPGGGRPGSAHVAISLGDGTTIEARGTRYGVGSWDAGDRFHYAAVIPELGTGDFVPSGVGTGPALAAQPQGPDTDTDGAADDFEMSRGLDPLRPDSDDDGLADGFELAVLTDGLDMDTDRDGLSDAFEVQAGLDAHRADSDGDGLTDAYELAARGDIGGVAGLTPFVMPGAMPGEGAGLGPVGVLDSDDDGLSDAWETTLGTNPLHADSDDDGIGDALEAAHRTDPLRPADLDDEDDDPADP